MRAQIKNLVMKNNRFEKGQAMLLIALAMIGLIAFIGLAIDAGILFSHQGHLRRGVDAAALSAANQIRQGWSYTKVETAAQELILLNLPAGSPAELQVIVETCDTPNHSIPNCDTGVTKRKLARVEAVLDVKLAFMPIVGWDNVPIKADAISEAASIDLLIVIDNSTSMAYDAACDDGDDDDEYAEVHLPGGSGVKDSGVDDCNVKEGGFRDDYFRDPKNCNDIDPLTEGIQGVCQPFEKVRTAAKILVDQMFEGYDRMGLVTFNRFAGLTDPPYTINNIPWAELPLHEPNQSLTGTKQDILDALNAMTVYPNFDPPYSNYCYEWDANYNPTDDPSGCMRTNIAAALRVAGDHLNDIGREDAVKVLVLLSDGIANAAYSNNDILAGTDPKTIDWYCPDSYKVWSKNGDGQLLRQDNYAGPFCADGDPNQGYENAIFDPHGAGYYHSVEDAEDAARFWADWVGCLPSEINAACSSGGAGVIMFTIGLGDNVVDYNNGRSPVLGEELLRYIARVGYNGDPSEGNDLCYGVPNSTLSHPRPCGNYYFAPEPEDLTAIFKEISNRIFTRLTH